MARLNMLRPQQLLPLMIGLAAGCAALGHALSAAYWSALLCVLAAGAWLRFYQRTEIAASLGFAALTLLSGLRMIWGAPPWLMLAAVVAALGAWDLSRLQRHLSATARIEHVEIIERTHVRRLLLTLGAGLALSALALLLHVGPTFPTVAALTLVTLFALGSAIMAWRAGR